MSGRWKLVAATIVVVGTWWFWSAIAIAWSDPIPSAQTALTVARAYWTSYCSDPDTEWPCVVVTDIELASPEPKEIAADPSGIYEAGKGYCFKVSFQVETTP